MEINICDRCKGEGHYQEDIGTHHSDYITVNCEKCNCTGKVIKYKPSYPSIVIPYTDDYSIRENIASNLRKFHNDYIDFVIKIENDKNRR
jgi:DnaJ-class molecular chaperone